MTIAEVQRFYEKIQHNVDFFQLFNNALLIPTNEGQAQAIVDFAQAQGFNFSVAELKQASTAQNLEHPANLPDAKMSVNKLERIFIWLSGASPKILATCPESEQKKHAALGGAVLIPALLAIVTASFLLYTLNFTIYAIAPVALLWSCIILLMDRAILGTYRKGYTAWGKFWQFSLRFAIALLIAVTVAHPVVLLLFSERIEMAYNEGRIKIERQNLALQCDLKNPQSELRLLDTKINTHRTELKNGNLFFEPAVCQNSATPTNQTNADNIEKLAKEVENLKNKQKQADQDVTLFTANAEKEKQGIESSGFTGVRGCNKGTQCKRWLSQASDRKDDSIKLSKEILRLEGQINSLNEKTAKQVIEGKQAAQKQCEQERTEVKSVRVKQHDLDQLSLVSLNEQRNLLLRRCAEKETAITQLKPDVLTQTELLTHLIFTKDGISWHNLLIFIIFMLLFLTIDLLAVVLKMTHIGLYETKVDISENQNQLLEFIHKRHQTQQQFFELISQEQQMIERLNTHSHKQDFDDNLQTLIQAFMRSDRQKFDRFFEH